MYRCTHVENKIKAEHPKKFKLLCLRTYTHEVFEIKIATLICSSSFSAYNMPKNIMENSYIVRTHNKKIQLGLINKGIELGDSNYNRETKSNELSFFLFE